VKIEYKVRTGYPGPDYDGFFEYLGGAMAYAKYMAGQTDVVEILDIKTDRIIYSWIRGQRAI